VAFPLDKEKDFVLDTDKFIEAVKTENAKVVFLCNPNNPTGGLVPLEHIEK